MAGFAVKREEAAGKTTLVLDGTLDGQAARAVQLLVAELAPTTSLVVDFSRVREFHDYSVGVLGVALQKRDVELLGLRTHHARMFEYFGVTAGAPASERAYYTPEELLFA